MTARSLVLSAAGERSNSATTGKTLRVQLSADDGMAAVVGAQVTYAADCRCNCVKSRRVAVTSRRAARFTFLYDSARYTRGELAGSLGRRHDQHARNGQ